MSYTIYPDELFVTNLVMDYYLLRLVKNCVEEGQEYWLLLEELLLEL